MFHFNFPSFLLFSTVTSQLFYVKLYLFYFSIFHFPITEKLKSRTVEHIDFSTFYFSVSTFPCSTFLFHFSTFPFSSVGKTETLNSGKRRLSHFSIIHLHFSMLPLVLFSCFHLHFSSFQKSTFTFTVFHCSL